LLLLRLQKNNGYNAVAIMPIFSLMIIIITIFYIINVGSIVGDLMRLIDVEGFGLDKNFVIVAVTEKQ